MGSKIMAQQAITLNRVEEELPSAANISKLDDIELQEIMERTTKSMENLIPQLEGESSKNLLLSKLLGHSRAFEVRSKSKRRGRFS